MQNEYLGDVQMIETEQDRISEFSLYVRKLLEVGRSTKLQSTFLTLIAQDLISLTKSSDYSDWNKVCLAY